MTANAPRPQTRPKPRQHDQIKSSHQSLSHQTPAAHAACIGTPRSSELSTTQPQALQRVAQRQRQTQHRALDSLTRRLVAPHCVPGPVARSLLHGPHAKHNNPRTPILRSAHTRSGFRLFVIPFPGRPRFHKRRCSSSPSDARPAPAAGGGSASPAAGDRRASGV
eukprot:1290288-Prymnesium_polylepis.1